MGLFRRPPQPQQPRPRIIPAAPAGGAVDFTGSWTQSAATWDATAVETITSTGAWTQATATWSASLAETDTSTASWTQAAASWSASLAETVTSTASFVQAASSWDAVATSADNSFVGSWTQATATWDAVLDTPISSGGMGGRYGRIVLRAPQPKPEPIPQVAFAAAFVQPPASWRAEMDTFYPYESYALLDEPALIGAR